MATYFSGMTVQATLAEMEEAFGPPDYARNYGSDKVNFEFRIVFNGITYTIYDWKEYRTLEKNDVVEWHIGTPLDDNLAIKTLVAWLEVQLERVRRGARLTVQERMNK